MLQEEPVGHEAHCPICNILYVKGRQWVLDPEGFPVNEVWEMSVRPTYCTMCGWQGMMRDTQYVEGDCFPHRCPKCYAVVANRKGEE